MLMDTDFPAISVVVIGRNEGNRLVKCLESVRAADYAADKIELIYVDSASTDASCSNAVSAGAKVLNIPAEGANAAAARNTGFRAARHELVQFLDGDTILDGRWLRKGVEALGDPAVGCCFGRVEEMAPGATIYNFWAHHDWYVPPGPADRCGGIAMFRRQVLNRANGFDESLIAGEEPDLCHRIRREQRLILLSVDQPMALHDIDMTSFRQYWKRCIRTGHAYAEVGARHRDMRQYRVARWLNLAHAASGPVALVLSVCLGSAIPVAVWAGALVAAVIRNAVRLRGRLGTFRSALLYSVHHYIGKTPMAVGQCTFWLRSALGKSPSRIIEYR